MIITGDFNLPTSEAYSYFEHIIHANELTQLVTLPTRLNNILDLIFTNNKGFISEVKVEDLHISDHRMISAKLTELRPVYPEKVISFRDFKNANFEKLGKDICDIEVLPTTSSTTVLVQDLTSCLLKIFDKHVPIVNKTIIIKPKQIFPSNETLKMKLERDFAYKTIRVQPTEDNVNHYKQLRRMLKN